LKPVLAGGFPVRRMQSREAALDGIIAYSQGVQVPDKLRVFVSHSFEDRDREFVDHVLTLLKQRKFHFDVRTARPAEGGPFPDKIEGQIEWADITFGLFTQKFADETGHPLPPPYVISECSYALGRYRDVERKAVHGFVEKGKLRVCWIFMAHQAIKGRSLARTALSRIGPK
jgi:hypothetical protein